MVDPVRLAVVGCGRIAQVAHLPAVEKAEGVELVAVSDPSGAVVRSVARRWGVAASADQGSVWADASVEAVIVAAPDRFHHRLATEALTAGRHVLVEKPLATTVAEAEELVGLVDRTGLALQVGAMKRHDPGVRYAARFIAERLGQVRSFNAWYRIGDLRPGLEAALFPPVVAEPAAGRREAAVKADRRRYLLATHRAHVWQLLLTTAAGAVGTVTIAADVPGLPAEGIEVFGATGAVRVELHFPFSRRPATVHAYADGAVVVPTLTDGDAYRRQVEAFARAIRTGGHPAPDVRDGLAAVRLIEATATAVETGTEVAP
jgi:predicted dehydrogenase